MAISAVVREANDTTAILNVEFPDALLAEGEVEYMRTVVLNVEDEEMFVPIADPDGGKWRIGVNGPVNETQDVDGLQAQFILPAGNYTGGAQRMNVNGAPVGPLKTATFTVIDLVKAMRVAKALTVNLV